jgi:hypothetical protein
MIFKVYDKSSKLPFKLGVVAYSYNPSTQEICELETTLTTKRSGSQHGLHNKILPQKKNWFSEDPVFPELRC